MDTKLDWTTFDKIEIGQHFYTIHNNNLNYFEKMPFEKALNLDDNSINHFQNWTGVYTLHNLSQDA